MVHFDLLGTSIWVIRFTVCKAAVIAMVPERSHGDSQSVRSSVMTTSLGFRNAAACFSDSGNQM